MTLYCDQYATTIAVEVGLHHASPPLSYCGKSPWWISCEYVGTSRSGPVGPVNVVLLGKLPFWLVRFDAIALRRLSVGPSVVAPTFL